MTDKTTEALKLAEEALDELRYANDTDIAKTKYYKALAAIREALAEPVKQEPVAIVVEVDRHGDATVVSGAWQLDGGKHTFYGAPVFAKSEWVYLTDDEMWDVFISKDWTGEPLQLMSAVIAAFKEKNR